MVKPYRHGRYGTNSMLKFTDYDIVFQEIPDETTLAINLSLCPCHCTDCHSSHLALDIGEELTTTALDSLLQRYSSAITCVSLMGGDNDPQAVAEMALYIHRKGLRSAWYSGRPTLPDGFNPDYFDYVKIGPFIPEYGGLDHPTTNQRLFHISNGKFIDITSKMFKSIR